MQHLIFCLRIHPSLVTSTSYCFLVLPMASRFLLAWLTFATAIASPFPHNVLSDDSNNIDEDTVLETIGISSWKNTVNTDTDITPRIVFATNNEEDGAQHVTDQLLDKVSTNTERDGTPVVYIAAENLQDRIRELQRETKALQNHLDELVRHQAKSTFTRRKKKQAPDPDSDPPPPQEEAPKNNNNIQTLAVQTASQIGATFQKTLLLTHPEPKYHQAPSLSPHDIQALAQRLAKQGGRQQLINLDPGAIIARAVLVAPALGIALRDTELLAAVVEFLPEILGAMVLILV